LAGFDNLFEGVSGKGCGLWGRGGNVAYVEVLGINFAVLGEIEVLLRHEYTL